MMSHRLLGAVLGLALLSATFAGERAASAAPGTCKCNSGCHGNPGQCVKGAACSIGYAPTCGYRGGDSGTTSSCPKIEFISCNGECSCVPIPGFCETVGGAEFCDAGPEPVPDTSAPDTFVPDTAVTDTFVPDAVPDTFVPDAEPDTFVPDTFVSETDPPDTFSPDTEPPPDTFVPPTDTCVPLMCPPGTKAISIAGECDPFCAQPCGSGEFKCSGLVGTECREGFCVPRCLVSGCPDCKKCSLGDGTCFDDPASCDGGVPDGFTTDTMGTGDGTSTGDSTAVGDGTATEDSTIIPGDDTGGTSTGDSSAGADGDLADTDPFAPADPVAGTEESGGCGCAIPGSSTETSLAALAGAAGLAMLFARRRRK